MKKYPLQVIIDNDLYESLRDKASLDDLPLATYVRRLLKAHVSGEESNIAPVASKMPTAPAPAPVAPPVKNQNKTKGLGGL